ncbi:MAG: M23 family metallopeptidase [Gammaproteobacteria bacterium]|nr:M23 family metallopeptidase [Gammaproteobacteria bacterium]MCB1925908.1 M23 family metallopeptidase [Gammaproteobacteria bacterium]
MKIIFLSDFCKRTGSIDICVPRAATLAVAGLLGLTALGGWAGFVAGERYGIDASVGVATAEVQTLLATERRVIADAKAEQRAHLDAMALKIAELQAHLMRLDALGGRLVEVGKLDSEEFDFANAPPVGGVEDAIASDSQSASDLSGEMQRLADVLEDRENKLRALEAMLMNRELRAEVVPSGRPVTKGWMSSSFGKRTDPFNGKKSYHRGVDFAGKRGSDVVAVASGVVVRAETASGFGNVVEIRHADGYSTLYGHNKQNLVKVGDVVSKGDTIALLGSTGRSSGPHVHFEVHRDGRAIDPVRFVSAN